MFPLFTRVANSNTGRFAIDLSASLYAGERLSPNMASLDDLDYLTPGFDLNSLTVPRLRSILVNHDIPYPASAKKAQLIGILQDEVLPQAKKLLREREQVKRTSFGIVDMGGRGASVNSDLDDRGSLPPRQTPSTTSAASGVRRGRSTRSGRASTADTEDKDAATTTPVTTPRKRTGPRSTGGRARASESEADDESLATPSVAVPVAGSRRSATRQLRNSDIIPSDGVADDYTPRVKIEGTDDGNVFSDDNPFQSGSPNVYGSHGITPASHSSKGKRKSRLSTEPFPKEEGVSRKSETPTAFKSHDADTSLNFLSPSQLGKPNEEFADSEAEDSVSAGEEFTPEEQLALEKEHADLVYANPRAPLPKTKSASRSQNQGTASKAISWMVILSVLGGFAYWWRKEKVEIGFCGIGKPTWSLSDTKVPDWASVLEPRCESCPPHAFCYPNFEVRCEHDFILKSHPLSFGGLIPLPPTCEPDSEKTRRVKAVSDRTLEELRIRRAKWECGGADRGQGAEVRESDLKAEVGRKRRKGMSDSEFDDLWKGAIGEIVGSDEVVSKTEK